MLWRVQLFVMHHRPAPLVFAQCHLILPQNVREQSQLQFHITPPLPMDLNMIHFRFHSISLIDVLRCYDQRN